LLKIWGMTSLTFSELIPILQVAIGPAVLVSGVGLLLLSMTNRLGRVIDRSRLLIREFESAPTEPRHNITLQLRILLRRGRLIRAAILSASLCLLLAATLIIALFACALAQIQGALLIAVLFIGSMVCLIVSLILFVLDINQALAAMQLDIGAREDE
jgi:Protein of unknown function (DUF2721)